MLNDNNLNDHSIDRNSISSQLEYDKLLSLGIKSIQKYSGEQWTDFNLHDPGVTILECLCFALTDLSYRTGFDLEQIFRGALNVFGDGVAVTGSGHQGAEDQEVERALEEVHARGRFPIHYVDRLHYIV